MQKIVYKGTTLGIKIDKISKGSNPVTAPKEFIQMVTLKHSKGAHLEPHVHTPRVRKTTRLQECLVVRKGRVRLDLYTQTKEFVKYIYLHEGQAFISLNGGLGVKVIEDAEIIEIKNGPFKVDKVLI